MKKGIFLITLLSAISLMAVNGFSYERGGSCGDCYGPGYGNQRGKQFHHRKGAGGSKEFKRLDILKAELELSDKQVNEIFDIGQKFRKKKFENRGNVDRLLELKLERRRAIKSVLNDKQKKEFDELSMRRRGHRKGHKMGGPGFPGKEFRHLDMLKAELGLSDRQVRKIFDVGTEYRSKYFENRKNIDKVMELRIKQRKEISKILTKEQKKKFDDLKRRRGPDNRRCGRQPRR